MLHQKLNNEFIRNVIILMTGTATAQAIPILISPLLTRLYSPEQFGIWALLMSIIGVLGVIANGRYQHAIMLPDKKEDAARVFYLSCIIALCFSALLFLLYIYWKFFEVLHGAHDLHDSHGYKLLSDGYCFILPFSILLVGIWQSLSVWQNRIKNYRLMAIGRITQAFVSSAVMLIFGYLEVEQGLLHGLLAGQLAIVLVLLSKDRPKNVESSGILVKYAKKYSKFPIYDIWASLLNSISAHLPIIFFSYLFMVDQVGYYGLALKVMVIPVTLIGAAVSQVYYEKAAKTLADTGNIFILTSKLYTRMIFIGVIPFGLVFLFGEFGFSLVFGESWSAAGTIAKYMAIWLIFKFPYFCISTAYVIVQNFKFSLIFNICSFILQILVLVFCFMNKIDFLDAVLYFSIVNGVVYFIGSLVLLFTLKVMPCMKSS